MCTCMHVLRLITPMYCKEDQTKYYYGGEGGQTQFLGGKYLLPPPTWNKPCFVEHKLNGVKDLWCSAAVNTDMNWRVCGALVQFGYMSECYNSIHIRLWLAWGERQPPCKCCNVIGQQKFCSKTKMGMGLQPDIPLYIEVSAQPNWLD